MNQPLTVNRDYWLTKNPQIKFRRVKKAYYGTYLLKATIKLTGASVRYYNHFPKLPHIINPTYEEYMTFLKRHSARFSTQKVLKDTTDRYIHVNQKMFGIAETGRLRIYDVRALYAFHQLLGNPPAGIKVVREMDNARIYGNDIDAISKVIEELDIPDYDILSIDSPIENEITALLSGKEINTKAELFKFKVFIKAVKFDGIPDLYNYLESIKDSGTVEVPRHCSLALHGPKANWSWRYYQRSYLYVKDEETVLFIKMLAGQRFADCVELIMPNAEDDK